jgi:hypothetical protein
LVTTAFAAEEVIEKVGAFVFLFWCAHCGYVFGLMCWLVKERDVRLERGRRCGRRFRVRHSR